METITIYRVLPNGRFGGDVRLNVRDPLKAPIPAGHTRSSPHPIPDGHYAVMRGGWKYIEGPEPAEPEPLKMVPQIVTMRQARLALLQANLLNSVASAIDTIPEEGQRTAAQIEWEYATEVERNAPLINLVAEQLALSADEVDDLFILAATL